MATNAQVPNAAQPVVQKDPTGNLVFTSPWYRFFQSVSGLVGGQANAPQSIAVGASPFSYESQGAGIVIVQGGTVTALDYGRNGAFTALGVTQGPIQISAGDVLRVTHTGAPNMTLVRQ
jgi:hypothetical protein